MVATVGDGNDDEGQETCTVMEDKWEPIIRSSIIARSMLEACKVRYI